ncbi:MAG: hypothetical protein QOD85_2326 [Gaiellaceae bacterium]|nr:hypothetical protein [Gaiellaceae bacterium]
MLVLWPCSQNSGLSPTPPTRLLAREANRAKANRVRLRRVSFLWLGGMRGACVGRGEAGRAGAGLGLALARRLARSASGDAAIDRKERALASSSPSQPREHPSRADPSLPLQQRS